MLTAFPVDDAAGHGPLLRDLKTTPERTLTLGPLAGALDNQILNLNPSRIFELAFALVLDAYTCCSEVAFTAVSIQEDVPHDTKLYTCEVNLQEARTIQGALESITCGNLETVYSRQVPCLLLCTTDRARPFESVTLSPSLVLSYSRDEYHTGDAVARLHYDSKLLTAENARRVCSQFAHTVDQITSQPLSTQLQNLSKLLPSDAEQLRKWNKIPQPLDFRTVHDRIGDWASRRPHEIAIHAWDGVMTRGELDLSSSDLARHLVKQECKPGKTVAVLIQKSVWTPVAMLAVLKSGAAFILLDQDLPLERLKVMTEIVSCTYAVASRENTALAVGFIDNVTSLSDNGEPLTVKSSAKEHPPNLSSEDTCTPDDTMFFCFTSGSSGNPKAVEIQHFAWSSGYRPDAVPYWADEGARVLHRASFNFIVSIVELLVPLMSTYQGIRQRLMRCALKVSHVVVSDAGPRSLWQVYTNTGVDGGRVCIPCASEHTNDLTNTIRRLQPTCVAVAPSLGKTLDPKDLPSLETMVFVGEPYPASLITEWMASDVKNVVNCFGCSEGCSYTSMRSIPASDKSSTNIGKSMSRRYWIVDPRDHNILLPIGATGELLIEGYSIAKGYFKDLAKSADAFIASPEWAPDFGAGLEGRRWYKTGDLVRYTDDGELILLGRKDFQVKLRGQRVEPGEVENQLLEAFGDVVQNVIVDVAYVSQDKEQPRLTAFLILKSKSHENNPSQTLKRQITDKLSQKLPSFMVPTHVIVLQEFPTTPSGKIDRRRLRGMELGAGETTLAKSTHASATVDENAQTSMLRKAWAQVLGVRGHEIAEDNTWTDLGGDSLTAISLAQKARESGLSITVADLLQHSTFADLAQQLQPVTSDQSQDNGPGDVPVSESGPVATTSFQKFTLDVSASSLHALVHHYLIQIRGQVDVGTLEKAAQAMFQRCDSLRMEFKRSDSEPDEIEQTVHELDSPEVARRVEIIRCEDADQEMETLLARLQASPDHDAWTLPAIWVFLVSPEKVRMLARFHHAIIDGTSESLIFDDFQRAINRPNALQHRPQFLPYLSKRLLLQDTASFDHWRNLLKGSSPTMLRRTATELAANDSDITPFSTHRIMVPYMAGRGFATLSTLVKAAWAVVLGGMSASEDVVFYHLLNGRDEAIAGSLDIVGCCVTEVPMRVKLSSSSTGRALLQQVQDQVLASTPHAQLGADTIAKHCSDWAENINYRHSSFVHYTNVEEVKHLQLGDGAYADVKTIYNSDAVQDFTITSSPLRGGGLHLEFEAPKTLYTSAELDTVADGLIEAIRLLAVESDATLRDVRDRLSFIRI